MVVSMLPETPGVSLQSGHQNNLLLPAVSGFIAELKTDDMYNEKVRNVSGEGKHELFKKSSLCGAVGS